MNKIITFYLSYLYRSLSMQRCQEQDACNLLCREISWICQHFCRCFIWKMYNFRYYDISLFQTNITDCERLACWPRVASSWKYTGLESLSGNPVSFRLTAPVCVNLLPPAVTRKWQQIKNDVYTNPINLLLFNQKAYLLHYKHDVYELTLWSQRDCNISWWTCSFEICLYK